MENKILVEKACEVLKNSYASYSNFNVGAALLCENGEVFCGVNIENASYGATFCAERSAISAAISCGNNKFAAIAIVGGKKGEIIDFCPPCGICRQVLHEFCDDNFPILLFNGKKTEKVTLGELLPFAFDGLLK